MLVIRLSRPPLLRHVQSCSANLTFCTVHRYPKLFDDQFKQLDDLCHTLESVEQEKELQTASVVDQVTRMHEISQELHAFPDENSQVEYKDYRKVDIFTRWVPGRR